METVTRREYAHDAELVFAILLPILSKLYDIKNIHKKIKCVEVSSGASLFSFGETFEVSVAANDGGSVVRVRAKSKVRWNVTSNVEGKAEELLDLLGKNLG